MPTVFDEPVRILAQWGLFTVLLPFVIIFAVVYGIFERVKLFEGTSEPRKIHQMLAFVIAFIAIASPQIVGAITTIAAIGTMTMVVLVMLAVVGGLVHGDAEPKSGFWVVVIVAGLAAIVFFLDVIGISSITSIFDAIIPLVIIVAVFYGLIWFVTDEGKSAEKPKAQEKKTEEKGLKSQSGERPQFEELPGRLREVGEAKL